jgi:hypothetical protein
MATVTRIETRKRGVVGWACLVSFWAFNILMFVALIAGVDASSDLADGLATDAERAGASVGAAIGVMMILMIWSAGIIILGSFVLLTRGKKVMVETVTD